LVETQADVGDAQRYRLVQAQRVAQAALVFHYHLYRAKGRGSGRGHCVEGDAGAGQQGFEQQFSPEPASLPSPPAC